VGPTVSARETKVTVQQALQAQTQRVDQQIAEFEARFVTSKNEQQQAPSESFITTEEDVQTLDETMVTDTYLDPFDEEGDEELVEDPWEPMNTRIFSFNMQADRYVLKPLATGYAWILPDPVERAIGRAIHNIRFVPRTMNNLFQQKWGGASVEAGRFLINSTVGIAGLFDVADTHLGLKPSSLEDLGQTLAMYGVRSGPYLVLPLLPPTTVRDGAGLVGDMLMDPLSYFIPFIPQVSLKTTETVNDRSQNAELFEGVETSTVDVYGAVRSGFMQRRSKAIKE
ncbi:MAG: VacJ family lipoprotein, partial [Nitrospirota bacterium]|nr:VacJ family lipoprotein [Nitrospirota bacterium]